jgi:hypothetical protein
VRERKRLVVEEERRRRVLLEFSASREHVEGFAYLRRTPYSLCDAPTLNFCAILKGNLDGAFKN